MDTSISRLNLIVSLILFSVVNTLSFGKVVEIADDRASIREFLKIRADGDERNRMEMVVGDGFGDSESLLLQASWWKMDPNPKWGYRIVENPKKADEFRFLTFAVKMDAPGSAMVIELLGFPGFNCSHPEPCWDHRLLLGDREATADWVKALFTQHAQEPPRTWTHSIVDMFSWALEMAHRGRPLRWAAHGGGKWTMDGLGLSGDHPKHVGDMHLDSVYLTQTREEAENTSRAVSRAGKLAVSWGAIKSQ
jgi:hypothetical protein